MRIDRVLPLTILCLTMFPAPTHAFRIMPGRLTPLVMEVTPDRTAPYEIVTATGFGLDRSMVRNVYLMDSKGKYRVEILEQTDRLLRFRVAGITPPGRKRLALELIGRSEAATDGSKLVEQDFYLDVDPVQLRDAPLTKPAFPIDFKRSLMYELAEIVTTCFCA